MTAIIAIESYDLRLNGHHVRKATQVKFSDGITIQFTEKMGKREAARQAVCHHAKEVAELRRIQ